MALAPRKMLTDSPKTAGVLSKCKAIRGRLGRNICDAKAEILESMINVAICGCVLWFKNRAAGKLLINVSYSVSWVVSRIFDQMGKLSTGLIELAN